MPNNVVLVTGFGPFGEHKINASWQAVQLIPGYDFGGTDIVIEEIPVVYKLVDNKIPELWKKYNPKLVVHVGVSSQASRLTVETQAFRTGYKRTDCEGCSHYTGEVCKPSEGEECIKTNINVDEICEFLNGCGVKACKSFCAGRYLCEYTYYKSLNINPARTLFIHVPPLNNPFTADELAKGISELIKYTLNRLGNEKQIL